MVDREARRQLSQALRQLVSGRITNDEYIDCWSSLEQRSSDNGLMEIGEFGYCLFGDTHTYKLRGRYRVEGETRKHAVRTVLFLRTGLEYEWPDWPWATWREGLFFVVFAAFGLLAAVAWWNDAEQNLWFAWVTIAFFTFCVGSMMAIWLWHLFGPAESSRMKEYKQAGDYDVWPFLRRADFERACREHHLLGR